VATSLVISLGNTIEGLLGAYLVHRAIGGPDVFRPAPRIFRFTALMAVVSTPISATFGVTSLCLGGYAKWIDYETIWTTWWLGDLTGALLVTPLVVLWATAPRLKWRPFE